ncbi:ribonuclease H2 subunit A [Russula ochroleuca]|jgi:ribonuclease H2 subunit A|uniref:Ribonuclease n=1 Tax=Russula ochroleuca TaxID=152965 RepID=A0A9P5N4E2_9AGAM|nr:ribonuclease H2 subunit A [Russula ochroleuca]
MSQSSSLDESGDNGPAKTRDVPSIVDKTAPLISSYTYHSPTPIAPGPYILGVDEAGRGPVLGPLVYGVAYCPASYEEKLNDLGFADSKTLSSDTRASLLNTLSCDVANLGWSVRVLSPRDISSGMLRRPPVNLNKQSQDATILLIREVLQRGIELTEVYVDALGATGPYEKLLSSHFPGISFTVTAKADSKYKIVGAASVAAKVTRDAWIEGWIFEEDAHESSDATGMQDVKRIWSEEVGSGYPSDPNTKTWVKNSLERTFGYPSIARFSWTTIKVVLDASAHAVEWIDDGDASLVKAFENATGHDKDRCVISKDLSLSSVGTL